ncbi:MAG: hypothetical protein HN790_17680 [Methylococcales bacterium]|jgi:hypothetical protein|nr:hypothetical protein [Methylococcales bacterium]
MSSEIKLVEFRMSSNNDDLNKKNKRLALLLGALIITIMVMSIVFYWKDMVVPR